MTAEIPWTPVSVATGYRGNPRVSTAGATAHGTSTVKTTVVATTRGTVLSVAKSAVPTIATHGSLRHLPRKRGNHHGIQRSSTEIATAVFAGVQTQQFPRQSAAVRDHCHAQSCDNSTHHLALPTVLPELCH